MNTRGEWAGNRFLRNYLGFCYFTQDRAPKLCQRYLDPYTPFVTRHFVGRRYRDIMGEVEASLHGTNDKDAKVNQGSLRFPILELLGLMKDDDEEDPGLRKWRLKGICFSRVASLAGRGTGREGVW